MMKHPLRHTPDNDSHLEPDQVSSATECTGLMPAMVYTDDEAENLSRMEGIHSIKPQNKQKD